MNATISAGAVVVISLSSISATRSKASWHFIPIVGAAGDVQIVAVLFDKLNGSAPIDLI